MCARGLRILRRRATRWSTQPREGRREAYCFTQTNIPRRPGVGEGDEAQPHRFGEGRAASSGRMPMPSPACTMRATTSKLFTWTRRRSGFPARAASSSMSRDITVCSRGRRSRGRGAWRRRSRSRTGGAGHDRAQQVGPVFEALQTPASAPSITMPTSAAPRRTASTIAPLRSSSRASLIAGCSPRKRRGRREGTGRAPRRWRACAPAPSALSNSRTLGAHLVDLREHLARVASIAVPAGVSSTPARAAAQSCDPDTAPRAARCAGWRRRARCGRPAPPW
jgi:hypothetical protein